MKLWSHQEAGRDYLDENGSGMLLWEPRCGKTGATISSIKQHKRILIVCPNSAKFVWMDDLKLWAGIGAEANNGKRLPTNNDVVVVNYESLVSSDPLSRYWDVVVFDEIHRLANPNSGMAKYLTSRPLPKRRIGLTGTLSPEGYHQAMLPFLVVFGRWFWHESDTESFAWSKDLLANWTWDERRRKWLCPAPHIIRCEAHISEMCSRLTQKQAGIDQIKTYRVVNIPAGEIENKLYAAAMSEEDPGRRFAMVWQAGSGLSKDGIAESRKLAAAASMAAEANGQVLLLYYFTASGQYLARALEKSGTTFAQISGSDDGFEYRGDVVKRLNAGKIKVVLAQVACVKVAINLSASDTLIYAENSWSGEARIQSEERLTCKGKERAVEVIDFCTRFVDGENFDAKLSGIVRLKKDCNYRTLTI